MTQKQIEGSAMEHVLPIPEIGFAANLKHWQVR
jgi:hypothetical protein